MATTTRFKLPDVGEGLTEAEVVSWHVKVGDAVEVNDTLCEIETAKSLVELPSPVSGVVETLHVPEGTTVPVGTALVSFRIDAAPVSSVTEAVEAPKTERPLVLVGPGPSEPGERRRHLIPDSSGVERRLTASPSGRARAVPAVRRLAREQGVDLEMLGQTSEGGLVTEADVASAIRQSSDALGARESRLPIKGVRRATAQAMVASAFTAPHVTEWLTVDATHSMELLTSLKQHPSLGGVRITPLVLVARALLLAIRRHPGINASWDEAAQEIVLHHYVNLGIAAATDRGLVVPNIKDAHTLALGPLAAAIGELVTTARQGKSSPKDLSGGTITITSLGSLGVDGGTPILNPGEAAILALGSIRPMPWVVDGAVQVRQVAHLALSFDHRLVDGALGSQVLVAVGEILTDPARALVYS